MRKVCRCDVRVNPAFLFRAIAKYIPLNWIVAEIVIMENGVLAEHWDVNSNEASKAESKSGLRRKRSTPISSSKSWICRLNAGCATRSCAAALVKFNASPTT
jgi:hypothetical protein